MRLAPEIAVTIADVPGVKSANRNVFTKASPQKTKKMLTQTIGPICLQQGIPCEFYTKAAGADVAHITENETQSHLAHEIVSQFRYSRPHASPPISTDSGEFPNAGDGESDWKLQRNPGEPHQKSCTGALRALFSLLRTQVQRWRTVWQETGI